MSAEKLARGFDPILRERLFKSFEKLEQLQILSERDLRTIYSSQSLATQVQPQPRPDVRQLNARFSNN